MRVRCTETDRQTDRLGFGTVHHMVGGGERGTDVGEMRKIDENAGQRTNKRPRTGVREQGLGPNVTGSHGGRRAVRQTRRSFSVHVQRRRGTTR